MDIDSFKVKMDILDKKKLRRKDDVQSIREDKRLEEGIKKSLTLDKRIPKKFDLKRYKREAMRAAIFSLCFLAGSLTMILLLMPHILDLKKEYAIAFSVISVAASSFFTSVPYVVVAVHVFDDSEIANRLRERPRIKIALSHTSDDIMISKHYCDLFLEIDRDKEKANHDHFVRMSQIYSRKALFTLINLTNDFLAKTTIKKMDYKKRQAIVQQVEDQLKNVHGALIMAFKGRVPKYVNDGIERVGRNILIIRGSA